MKRSFRILSLFIVVIFLFLGCQEIRQEEFDDSPGQDASEYIARRILSAPGQMTILATGPCTNIAKALVSHPEIASKTKDIITSRLSKY